MKTLLALLAFATSAPEDKILKFWRDNLSEAKWQNLAVFKFRALFANTTEVNKINRILDNVLGLLIVLI